MPVLLHLAVVAKIALGGAAVPAQDGIDPAVVFVVDPVELIDAGVEVAGKADTALEHTRYVYRFSNPDNRAKFEAKPERYAVRLGGACARMGGLGTGGRAEFWTVHDGGLYFFASKACRNTFRKTPGKFLLGDDARPDIEAGIASGKRLLEQALAAHGGKTRVDALATFGQLEERDVESGGKQYRVIGDLDLRFSNGFPASIVTTKWNDDAWVRRVSDRAGFFEQAGQTIAMHSSQRREHERGIAHHPIVVLRARTRDDFVVYESKDSTEAAPVIAVWFAGALTRLTLDAKTHRIVALRFEGRGPNFSRTEITRRFLEFAETNGVLAPVVVQDSVLGKAGRIRRYALRSSLAADVAPAQLDEIRGKDDEAWLAIPWRPALGPAVLEASKKRKPILLWAMNGHPLGCT